MSLNSVVVSGTQGSPSDGAFVYITYDSNQLGYGLPEPNGGNLDRVPSFIYFGGHVVYGKDAAGNMVAKNQ